MQLKIVLSEVLLGTRLAICPLGDDSKDELNFKVISDLLDDNGSPLTFSGNSARL